MKARDKSRLTKAKNAFDRWQKKYLANPSPYIIEKYRQALKSYNRVMSELKQKNTGEQIEFEL